jgi:hypothetical protein
MTRREPTFEEQVADAGEKPVRNLLLEAAGDARVS